MDNPIPQNPACATPVSVNDLFNSLDIFKGSELHVARLAATMALNLAHKLVEDQKLTA